jgi:hypothetical protein
MTTETNSGEQAEPRLLSEAETDTVVGGSIPGSAYMAMAIYYRCNGLGLLLPPDGGCRE